MAKKYRRRKNPLSVTAGGVSMLAVVAALTVGGYLLWQYFKKKGGPKSAAEKKVDDLYGKNQAWKNNPVYNTPGTAGYIPGLPAGYPPGTPASAMTIPPGVTEAAMTQGAKISNWFSGKTISSDPFNMSQQTGRGSATSEPLTTESPALYGVDDIEDVIGENITRFRRR